MFPRASLSSTLLQGVGIMLLSPLQCCCRPYNVAAITLLPNSSKLERRVKRLSDSSTIDLIPVSTSPTASVDNEPLRNR